MENPQTWKELDHVINDALERYHERQKSGAIGLSEVRVIADAVRHSGLLAKDPEHDKRPCKGTNSNVCVAEGCYDEACITPVIHPEPVINVESVDLCPDCGKPEGSFACKVRHLNINTGAAKAARDLNSANDIHFKRS